MTANYVLKKSGTGDFWFVLKAHTGEILLTSGLYADKDSAMRRISAARHLAGNEKNYEVLLQEGGKAYFLLKTARQEVLVRSELFPDAESLRKRINLIKGKTRGARLEDLTGQ